MKLTINDKQKLHRAIENNKWNYDYYIRGNHRGQLKYELLEESDQYKDKIDELIKLIENLPETNYRETEEYVLKFFDSFFPYGKRTHLAIDNKEVVPIRYNVKDENLLIEIIEIININSNIFLIKNPNEEKSRKAGWPLITNDLEEAYKLLAETRKKLIKSKTGKMIITIPTTEINVEAILKIRNKPTNSGNNKVAYTKRMLLEHANLNESFLNSVDDLLKMCLTLTENYYLEIDATKSVFALAKLNELVEKYNLNCNSYYLI